MKTKLFSKLVATGLVGLGLLNTAKADVTVVVAGGNATRAVQFDRAANLLSGETVVQLNANVRSYVGGTIPSQPGLGTVNIHFVLNGALGGLQDLIAQNNNTTATNGPLVPTVAVSGSAPETVGLSSAGLSSSATTVIPFGFIKNTAISPNLANVTNLTQRQATYFQSASGTLPSAFFGGATNNDIVYFVGRDNAAAVKQIIDASIYFTGSQAAWTTNRTSYTNLGGVYLSTPIGQPVPHPTIGHNSGALVVSDLNNIPNAIGVVASGDFGSFYTLSYEGYQPTPYNVAKGFYPIWGYEKFYWKNTGAGQPSAGQQTVINLLVGAITDYTFQHTPGNIYDTSKLVPLADLEVQRTTDGGPLTSLLY